MKCPCEIAWMHGLGFFSRVMSSEKTIVFRGLYWGTLFRENPFEDSQRLGVFLKVPKTRMTKLWGINGDFGSWKYHADLRVC